MHGETLKFVYVNIVIAQEPLVGQVLLVMVG